VGQNVIELNGKRYDAITGMYLGKSHVVPKHIAEQYIHGKVIDGFVRPSHTAAAKPATPKPAAVPTPHQNPAVQASNEHTHTPARHAHAHAPQHAKTLMHRHKRKPEFSLKPAIKTQAPAEIMANPASAIMHKRSAYGIDSLRQQRAGLTAQHQTIRHFDTSVGRAVHTVSQVPVLSVRSAPLSAESLPRTTPKKHTDIFEAAIAHASSHAEPMHKVRRRTSTRRKLLNSLAIVAAFLVIGGFIGYLNLPQIQLRVASVQAGFGASMPSYTPTGYALQGGVARSGGTVRLSFRSGSSYYTLTQQSSNWNSQTLLDNTLALNGEHQTVQKNGQTIYVYDNSTSASWVNGGVRYDLTGNAELSSQEITNIAISL
jgi:hypothetical protein